MNEETNVYLVMRVGAGDVVVPGSTQGQCSGCQHAVWHAPSYHQTYDAATMEELCFECVAQHPGAQTAEAMPLNSTQEQEVTAMGIDPKRGMQALIASIRKAAKP